MEIKTTLSIEESARLIELGVDKKLASDSAFVFDEQGNEVPYVKGYALKPNEYCAEIQFADEDSPSVMAYVFTLQDLLTILPKKITDRKRIYELKIWVDHYSDNWCIEYTHDIDVNDFEDSFVSAEELCDAVYQEICFLKTEKIKEI